MPTDQEKARLSLAVSTLEGAWRGLAPNVAQGAISSVRSGIAKAGPWGDEGGIFVSIFKPAADYDTSSNLIERLNVIQRLNIVRVNPSRISPDAMNPDGTARQVDPAFVKTYVNEVASDVNRVVGAVGRTAQAGQDLIVTSADGTTKVLKTVKSSYGWIAGAIVVVGVAYLGFQVWSSARMARALAGIGKSSNPRRRRRGRR